MLRNGKIGVFLATVLVANNMIGSGIFLLPATLASIGSVTIVGWILATAAATLIAVVFAKLGQIAPASGGPAAYARIALGPFMGFQASFIYWICCWIGNIAIAVAAIGYLAAFLPALRTPALGSLAVVAIIWLVTFVNIRGARFTCQVKTLTLFAGLIPILLVGTIGWMYFEPQIFTDSWNVQQRPALTVVPESLVLVFWAFVGLESASVATAVVENPERNVPLATIGGVVLAGVVYVAACAAIMGLLPANALAQSTAPFADAVRVVLGPIAGSFVALMALIKATGTLCGWVLLTAQTGQASAEHGLFPAVFARTNRHGVPALNLIVMAIIMSVVVAVTTSPTVGQQFAKLIEVSVILCLLVYVYAFAAIWHYGRSASMSTNWRALKSCAVVATLVCLFVIVEAGRAQLVLCAVIMLLTFPLYVLVKQRARPGSYRSMPIELSRSERGIDSEMQTRP